MVEADKQRLAHLLLKSRRRRRATAISQKWATRHVSASPLSYDRQQALLGNLRTWSFSDYHPTADLRAAISNFLGDVPLVVVIDFDVVEEPALLVPSNALLRSTDDLRSVYPDGFVLVQEGAALTVDFEDEGGGVNVSHAKAR